MATILPYRGACLAVIEANGFRFYTQSPFGRSALFAEAGVKGGHVFGVTDEKGERVIKSEWNEKRSIRQMSSPPSTPS